MARAPAVMGVQSLDVAVVWVQRELPVTHESVPHRTAQSSRGTISLAAVREEQVDPGGIHHPRRF